MKQPIISVLVPVYNVEKYLEKCLDSIEAQTLSDIEIICVNDGSTDDSKKILERYREKDPKIKIIDKPNGGLPSARNAGLNAATGQFVGFVDADDFVEKNMFEKMVRTAEQEDSDVVICGANIFPESEEIVPWLRNCLSPRESNYKKFDPEILFERVDTTPFLWRSIIRKSLIDQYDFRLDEDIVLGEDKAFQCKVYPKASGIMVIPDKLYNYNWKRTDSIMETDAYSQMSEKVVKHARLVERIAEGIQKESSKENEKNNTICKFLEWSIPFLYNDFLSASVRGKVESAELVISAWMKIGYVTFMHALSDEIKNAFEYIRRFNGLEMDDPLLSIVIPLEFTSRYLDELFAQIQKFENKIEFIIVNSGMPLENYGDLKKIMMYCPNIRLYNTPKHFTYAQCLNTGTKLVVAPYVCYMDSQDWFANVDKAMEWVRLAQESDVDLCTCNYTEQKICSDFVSKKLEITELEKEGFYLDFHNALYKVPFLRDKKILFKNRSTMTGRLFFGEVLLTADTILHMKESIYISREYHRQDWLSTENCEKVLTALDELTDLSVEYQNPYLHGMVYSILNGDMMNRIIVNNTKPYKMPTEQCPNGENSQIKTVRTLLDITNKMDYDLLRQCGFSEEECCVRTLTDVVEERNKFLVKMDG